MALSALIYSKTGKGARALTSRSRELSASALEVLAYIDSNADAATIHSHLDRMSEATFKVLLGQLEKDGYIRLLKKTTEPLTIMSTDPNAGMEVNEISPDTFFAMLSDKPEAKAPESAQLPEKPHDVEVKELEGQEVKALMQAEAEEEARRIAEEIAARNAREVAERQAAAEALAHAEAAEKARLAQEAAEREAEAQARQQAVQLAREAAEREAREAEEARKQEAAALVQQQAEAQARAKAEAAEKARIKAEQIAAEKALKQAQKEEAARLKAEAKVREKKEKLARQEAERQAKEEAKRQAALEAEQKTRAIEADRRLAEETARVKAEEDARRRLAEEAEKEALRLAELEAQAFREAEQAARVEAERQAKAAELQKQQEEAARQKAIAEAVAMAAAAEEKARKAQEKAAREEAKREAARVKAAEKARARAEKATQKEAERREKEAAKRKAEAEKLVRREQEALARQQAKVAKSALAERQLLDQSHRKPTAQLWGPTIKKMLGQSVRFVRTLTVYTLLLLCVLIGILHVVPLVWLTGPIQQQATAIMGEPVDIGEVRGALFPQVQLNLRQVTIGEQMAVKLEQVQLKLDVASIWRGSGVLDKIQISGVALGVDGLATQMERLHALVAQPKWQIRQIEIQQVALDIPGLTLPIFHASIQPLAQGNLGTMALVSDDGHLQVNLTPGPEEYRLSLHAEHWQPPGMAIKFNQFDATGVASGQQLQLNRVNATLYGGTLSGKTKVSWDGMPAAIGSFSLKDLKVRDALSRTGGRAALEGRLNAEATFTSRAPEFDALAASPVIQGNFSLHDGRVIGMDLASSTGVRGRDTRFDRLVGSVQLREGVYQYRQLVLTSDQLRATGQLEVKPDQTISGGVISDLKVGARRIQTNRRIMGTVAGPDMQ